MTLMSKPEGVSSTMTKFETAKDIHLQIWKVFEFWCEKTFCQYGGSDSIQTNIQAYILKALESALNSNCTINAQLLKPIQAGFHLKSMRDFEKIITISS